mmetsp:Transcript_105224/g.166117  ORF Transcript_105224/g.166117 Transcript_105224/m.166117 type:complete len:164 (-) Transcript_105224:55-546(-)
MRVYVEVPSGGLLPLTVAPESSVQETRRRISDRLQLPPEAVELTLGNDTLRDDALLWANGVCAGSTISVQLQTENLQKERSSWNPIALTASIFLRCEEASMVGARQRPASTFYNASRKKLWSCYENTGSNSLKSRSVGRTPAFRSHFTPESEVIVQPLDTSDL